jgi:hypothetical protein
MIDKAGAFTAGDIVDIRTAYTTLRASIICFRHAVGNHRTGTLEVVADLLFEDGKVGYRFLSDIARCNPEFVAKTFAKEEQSR